MKHFFNKSALLVLFTSAVNVILIVGLSLLYGKTRYFQRDTNDIFTIIGVTCLLVVLLILNVSDIVAYWLSGKEKEIRAKNIVGIPYEKIVSSIYINLNGLILCSFVVALLLSAVIVWAISSFVEISIHLFPVIFSFTFSIFLLNTYSMVILKFRLKKGFMETEK